MYAVKLEKKKIKPHNNYLNTLSIKMWFELNLVELS